MNSKAVIGIALFITGLASVAAQEAPDFNELDQNGNGLITLEEAQRYPALAEDFDQADANDDGFIDEAEYARWRARQ